MTGLDPDKEEILEIHCIITNGNLEVLDPEGWGTVIHFPASRLEQMGEWCTETHARTGLTQAVLDSKTTPDQAANVLLEYIKHIIPKPRIALLAGNSVHADRAFLAKGPYAKVLDHLHYRILDVSSIKEAAKRWCPPSILAGAPVKSGTHRGREDILESIQEARYYRDVIFGETWRQGEDTPASQRDNSEAWADNLM